MRITERQLRSVVRRLVRENLGEVDLGGIASGLASRVGGEMVPGDSSSFTLPSGHKVAVSVDPTRAPGSANVKIDITDVTQGLPVTRPKYISGETFDMDSELDAGADVIKKIVNSLIGGQF